MEMFFGLGSMSVFCMWNIFAIVGIIASLTWVIRKYNKEDNHGEYILDPKILKEWLIEKKEEGYKTVDDLIKEFTSIPANKEVKKTNILKSHTEEVQEEDIATFAVAPKVAAKKHSKRSLIDTFSASVLLYLGAALIIFAVFVFIAFTWDNYTNLTKSLLITVFTASMYITGVALTLNKRLKQAGLSFLFIASILFGFLGVGLWNFLFIELFPEGFHIYWLIWSLLMISVYGITLYILKLQQYFYFMLFAIYSTFYSFAYTVGSDANLRIVVFLALNFSLYLTISQTKSRYTIFAKTISRIINSILNLVVFLSIAMIASEIHSLSEKIMASIALIIPTLFGISVLLKDKSNAESAFELLFFPLKIIIFGSIFSLSAEVLMLFIFLYATVSTILSDIFATQNNKELYGFSRASTWIITIFSTIYFFVIWMGQSSNGANHFLFNTYIQALLIFGFGPILIIPEIHKKNKILFSISLLYPIFALLRLLNIFAPDAKSIYYILILLAFVYTLTLAAIYFYQHNYKNRAATLLLSIVATSATVLMLSLLADSALAVATGFGLVSVVVILFSIIYKKQWLMALSAPLILTSYPATLNLLDDKVAISLTGHGLMGIWFLIPIFIYAFLFENAYFAKKRAHPYMFGFLLFAFFGFLGATEKDIILFNYLAALTVYAIYALMRFKNNIVVIFLYALATFTLWAGLDLFHLPTYTEIFATTTLWLGFNLVGYLAERYLHGSKHLNILKTFSLISTILTPFVMLSMLGDVGIPLSAMYVLTGFVLTINTILSDRLNNIFGNISGINIIFIIWHISTHYSLDTQFYVIPVTIYLSALALRYHLKNKTNTTEFLKYSALIIQFTSLLLQSMFEIGNDKLWFGLGLIFVAIITLLIALYKKDYKLVYFALAYIFVELFIRLYVFIVKIPWWIYLGLTGLGIMAIAIYILWKIGEKKS